MLVLTQLLVAVHTGPHAPALRIEAHLNLLASRRKNGRPGLILFTPAE